MTDLDTSLNTSKKSLLCNHCMYDCQNYDNMKDHYRSEFHKYNLNRVTMNLNPLNFEEYTKKKEMYQKLHESKLKEISNNKTNSEVAVNLVCDVCTKKFSSQNKFKEHMSSRAHKRAEEQAAVNPVVKTNSVKNPENEKTTLDDVSICLFCNRQSENVEGNIIHMIDTHKFDVPFIFCVKNVKGMIRLMGKKIVTYLACLTCDNQNFKNYKSLQNHMIDKGHTTVNEEDLEEFLYKFYSKKSLFSIKDREMRKSKEFKILKIKLKMKKPAKKAETEGDGWETASEGEEEKDVSSKIIKEKDVKKEVDDYESEEEYEPITLPNGELLLENGTVIGSKLYQIYYKQRVHLNKFESLIDNSKVQRLKNLRLKNLQRKIANKTKEKKKKFYSIEGSNKASFKRINTLFHVEMYC